jgi:hypothetical protein
MTIFGTLLHDHRQQLQERVLEVPELRPHFVNLLGATPIAPWGAKKLLELARTGELEAWRFGQLSYGRIHETISDTDLADILSALNELEEGASCTLSILDMRFYNDRNSDYVPSEPLRSVGRKAICKLLSLHRTEFNRNQMHGLDRVMEECLSDSAPNKEIGEIVGLLCEGIESYRLYSSDLEEIIAALVENFPELVLNRVFKDDNNNQLLAHSLFKERVSRSGSSLNLASVDRLVKWCDGNQERVQKIASLVSSYSSVEKQKNLLDNPKQVALTSHIKALLEIADNKNDIVETIFAGTWPDGWAGSLAEILEVRSKAFAELLNHHSPEVRELAKAKLTSLEEMIRKKREQEAEEYGRREQRFE